MNDYYFTFRQVHSHRVNGITFDCDSVCLIKAETEDEASAKAFEYFGDKWCFQYSDIDKVGLGHYPRGIIPLERT